MKKLFSLLLVCNFGINILSCLGIKKLGKLELKSYYSDYLSKINNINLAYLDTTEYIIPNEIFEVYKKSIGEKSPCVAFYLKQNYMGYFEKRKFINELKRKGYDEKDIAFYLAVLTKEKAVVIKECALKKRYFTSLLLHERIHKELDKLPREDYNKIMEAVKFIIKNVKFKPSKGSSYSLSYLEEIIKKSNPEEFIAYLLQGEIDKSTEKFLKKKFPHVYKTLDKIKTKVRNSLYNFKVNQKFFK